MHFFRLLLLSAVFCTQAFSSTVIFIGDELLANRQLKPEDTALELLKTELELKCYKQATFVARGYKLAQLDKHTTPIISQFAAKDVAAIVIVLGKVDTDLETNPAAILKGATKGLDKLLDAYPGTPIILAGYPAKDSETKPEYSKEVAAVYFSLAVDKGAVLLQNILFNVPAAEQTPAGLKAAGELELAKNIWRLLKPKVPAPEGCNPNAQPATVHETAKTQPDSQI